MTGGRDVDGSSEEASESAARDRRSVRRALLAGGVVWAALGGTLVVVGLLAGADGAAGFAAVMAGLVAGALVASAWLLLAVFLDLLAGAPVGRRRVAWTAGLVLLAFVSPFLLLGAQAAR